MVATLQLDSSGTTANAVIDVRGDELWWASKESFYGNDIYGRSYRWLSDGRLLWVDETHRVLEGNSQRRTALDAPAPVRTIAYASNDIGFGIPDDLAVWRVGIESHRWEEVANPRPPLEGYLGGYFGISQDGGYALAFQSGQMWRIPAKMSSAAEPLPDVQMALTILGSGMPAQPPQQLARTPFWLISLPFQTVEESSELSGIVVDTRDGTVLKAEDLGLGESLYLLSYDMSPEGEWLAITVAERETQQASALHLISTDNLQAQPLAGADHKVAGWHSDLPAVILRNRETGGLSLRLLPSGETDPIPLPGASELVATVPGAIFATQADNPTEILRFDLSGNVVDSLALPLHNNTVRTAAVAGKRLLRLQPYSVPTLQACNPGRRALSGPVRATWSGMQSSRQQATLCVKSSGSPLSLRTSVRQRSVVRGRR